MKIEPNPCKYCGRTPQVVSVRGDLFYAQCLCDKWHPYEFVGATSTRALENWNTFNPPIKKEQQ